MRNKNNSKTSYAKRSSGLDNNNNKYENLPLLNNNDSNQNYRFNKLVDEIEITEKVKEDEPL